MIKLVNKKENIFGDNIAFVEYWDFSQANMNDDNRIMAITQVASICYQSPKALGSKSLYDRLMAESQGLPSSSFEFVPVLLDPLKSEHAFLLSKMDSNIRKFGEWILDSKYLLTNYRALVYDSEAHTSHIENQDIKDEITKKYLSVYNSLEECNIIKEHFKVFLYKVDFPTRSQMVRHRVNWQELSRRYVSGKRVPFDFYISEKMKDIESTHTFEGLSEDTNTYGKFDYDVTTNDVIQICLEHYYKALEDGVKPQEARRIIPQAGYSQIWGAFQPTQLENYFKLRLDSHAQWEIRKTAEAMKELIEKDK